MSSRGPLASPSFASPSDPSCPPVNRGPFLLLQTQEPLAVWGAHLPGTEPRPVWGSHPPQHRATPRVGGPPTWHRLPASSLPWGPGPGGRSVCGHSGHLGAQGLALGRAQGAPCLRERQAAARSAVLREPSALSTFCCGFGQQGAPAGRLGGMGPGVWNRESDCPRAPSVQGTSPVFPGDFATGRWLASEEVPVTNQRLGSVCGSSQNTTVTLEKSLSASLISLAVN